MEAQAENLKAFLAKRGYDAEVSKVDNTFFISLSSKTVEEVAQLLVTIKEPGRFVVSVQFTDFTDWIITSSGLPEKVADLKEMMDELERQTTESTSALFKAIDELKQEVSALKAKPWWKKW